MIKFFIGFFGWLGFIRLEVGRNYQLIEVEKERPNYLHSFGFRAFFAIACLALMAQNFDPFVEWKRSLPFVIYEVTSFYLAFDFLLNKRRGKAWDYQGSQSGWLDSLGKEYYYYLKILCAILFVCSVFFIFRYMV